MATTSRGPAERERCFVEGRAHRLDDIEPARIGRRDLFERGQAALVALDRDDARCALGEQRARQSARPGSDFEIGLVVKRRRRPARCGAVRLRSSRKFWPSSRRAESLSRAITSRSGGKRCRIAHRVALARFAPLGDLGGELERRDEAGRIGDALAGDVERGAVIGRGAHERQAERDIDAGSRSRGS